jgi:hypothetical protein
LEKRYDQDMLIPQIPLPPGQRPYGPAAIPLFQRGKYFSSLWKREVGRDFMKPFPKCSSVTGKQD